MVDQAEDRKGCSTRPSLPTRMQPEEVCPRRREAIQHPPRQRLPTLHLRFWPQPADHHHREQPLLLGWLHWGRPPVSQASPAREAQQLPSSRGSDPWWPAYPKVGRLLIWGGVARVADWEVSGGLVPNQLELHGDPRPRGVGEEGVR